MTVASGVSSESAGRPGDPAMEAYRRLAAMDPPAMRSLVAELKRMSDESSASAVQQGTAEAAARAGRNAQRAAAAQAALASVEAHNRVRDDG